jgi:hypothetical protein
MTILLLSHDSRTELWMSVGRENCCWPSPAQSFLVPSLAELMIVFYSFTTLGILYYCVIICCRGDVSTVPLPSNDRLYSFHYSRFQMSYHITSSLGRSSRIVTSPRRHACDVCDRVREEHFHVVLAPTILFPFSTSYSLHSSWVWNRTVVLQLFPF